MARLDWLRTSDGATSESELGLVSLRVERDLDSWPPYTWEVRGACETRKEAFEAAERAALAAGVIGQSLDPQKVDELLAYVHRQQAYVVVDGRPDNNTLLPVLMAARAYLSQAPADPVQRRVVIKPPRKQVRKPGPKPKAKKGASR